MTTEVLDDNYDLQYSAPEIYGRGYICDVLLIRKSDNTSVRAFRGEGSTPQKAENSGKNKAKEAYYSMRH
ncbi:hypothetical protein [Herbaspirillum rubrisubalbicans]|uniref:hypothetical protein n=1 Tax=Herbaspirillum rubrisubalbicans TaxID=80842 RepID=UPI0015C53963|nr:hypothetical protein [Herbaspirillum rubrisubalbicans]NQE51858.1 hypothetical protein [Herbaspirillum rubrisubalbicans]